uniref:Putative secreted protein n=1 Tax=Anopheles darlingi TaxID=43151 RepID=A0A2M4D449_ANODA
MSLVPMLFGSVCCSRTVRCASFRSTFARSSSSPFHTSASLASHASSCSAEGWARSMVSPFRRNTGCWQMSSSASCSISSTLRLSGSPTHPLLASSKNCSPSQSSSAG